MDQSCSFMCLDMHISEEENVLFVFVSLLIMHSLDSVEDVVSSELISGFNHVPHVRGEGRGVVRDHQPPSLYRCHSFNRVL